MATKESRAAGLRVIAAVVVLASAYLVLALVVGRQVPAQATVEGVNVGGMTQEVASATLRRELGPTATAPIVVSVADTGASITIDPASSGLALDIDGTLEGMAGFSLNPVRIWEHLTGRIHRPMRATVDRPRLQAAVESAARAVETAPQDGTVTFPAGKVSVTPSVVGSSLEVEVIVDSIASGYPRTGALSAEARRTPPKVTQDKLDAAVTGFAVPAMSSPISLVVGTLTAPLLPSQVAPALSMVPDASGTLTPTVDKPKLQAIVGNVSKGFLPQPRDARIELQGGVPVVVPAADGAVVDPASIPDAVLKALTDPRRTATLTSAPAKAAFTTEQATALGVTSVISSFDSTFPDNPSRTANLVAAANTINGTFLAPGATFSLNGILGERTADKGYQEGYVIEGGRLVKGTGGGISQVSTVVYNLAWFAGGELLEHTAHSFYISRYPEGREATVYWPSIDNTWKNASPYGMLVQMYVSDNQVHGRVWSTKVYDVESVKSPRTNVRAGREITDDTTTCVPQPVGTPGFDVTVTRVLKRDGAVVKNESYPTRYDPEDKITCTNPHHAN
ncbi:MAG: VanW family protein [Lapillicoccus sp.]